MTHGSFVIPDKKPFLPLSLSKSPHPYQARENENCSKKSLKNTKTGLGKVIVKQFNSRTSSLVQCILSAFRCQKTDETPLPTAYRSSLCVPCQRDLLRIKPVLRFGIEFHDIVCSLHGPQNCQSRMDKKM